MMKDDNYRGSVDTFERSILGIEARKFGCFREVEKILEDHEGEYGMNLAWDHLREREVHKEKHLFRLRSKSNDSQTSA